MITIEDVEGRPENLSNRGSWPVTQRAEKGLNTDQRFFRALAVPLGEGTISRSRWLRAVLVRETNVRSLPRRDVNLSAPKDQKRYGLAREE